MIVFVLIVLGLVFGSFVNAAVWRLNQQSKNKTTKKSKEFSILYGRSICPNCKHQLKIADLMPIFSWLLLKGKCRYCHKKISKQYPIVEAITALLFVLSYVFWPYLFTTQGKFLFVFWLAFLVGFLILAIYDLRWKILPNRVIFLLIGLALIQLIVKLLFLGGIQVIESSLYGIIFSSGLFYVLFLFSQGRWIGGGDVKLGIVLGLLIGGPSESILMIFIASLIGSLISIPLLLFNKVQKNSQVPFGPLLLISTTICYFFGPQIISWYTKLLF